MVGSGRASFFGAGREALAYPDWACDLEAGGALDPRRVCTACSKCSEMLRGGGRVGCPVRDSEVYLPEYRSAREALRSAPGARRTADLTPGPAGPKQQGDQ